MVHAAAMIVFSVFGNPGTGLSAPAGPPPAALEGQQGRLAVILVRRYCLPAYVMKSLRKGNVTGQWTWASVELPDGKWRVAVDDFTWDVETGSGSIEPGPVVAAAIEKGRLPEVCLCAEGIPRPPDDWEPAPEEAEPESGVAVPPDGGTTAPGEGEEAAGETAGTAPPHASTGAADGTARPAAKAASSPRKPASPRKTASSDGSGGLPGWLPGTWEGTTTAGARVRVTFSRDGTWKREVLGSGGRAELTVSGTWKIVGSAIRLRAGSVRTAKGAKPAERPPKEGSSVDAYCYRGSGGGLIMLTSGNTLRARRVGD